MKVKATFNSSFSCADRVDLINIISIDNEKQTKEFFRSFVILINDVKIKAKIKKLIIVDTTYLNRHYDQKYAVYNDKETPWRKENASLVEGLACDYELVSWRSLLDSEEYKDYQRQMNDDYEKDKIFRNIINTLAGNYLHKGEHKKAVSYLLEECAGTLVLNGHLTYPGDLNPALRHVIRKHKPELKFHSYKCRTQSEKEIGYQVKPVSDNGDYSPSFFAKSIAYLVENSDIPPEKQPLFTLGLLRYCHLFKSDHSAVKNILLGDVNYEEKSNDREQAYQPQQLPGFN